MSSTHKTFQTGEILSADDVNNALNPDTADHIPRAMAAGTASLHTPSSSTVVALVKIAFPAGRFTKTPVVTVSMATASGGLNKLVARAWDITPSGATLGVYQGDGQNVPSGATIPLSWIAVQMDA